MSSKSVVVSLAVLVALADAQPQYQLLHGFLIRLD